jgi:hypothetical protein
MLVDTIRDWEFADLIARSSNNPQISLRPLSPSSGLLAAPVPIVLAYWLRAETGNCEHPYRKFIAFAPESKQRPATRRARVHLGRL